MVKYIKFVFETEDSMKHVMKLSREFATKNFKKCTIHAWDTNQTDDTFIVSFTESGESGKTCGKQVGKINGKPLVCGINDYVCPNCRQ